MLTIIAKNWIYACACVMYDYFSFRVMIDLIVQLHRTHGVRFRHERDRSDQDVHVHPLLTMKIYY